jgi:hypothetical protein
VPGQITCLKLNLLSNLRFRANEQTNVISQVSVLLIRTASPLRTVLLLQELSPKEEVKKRLRMVLVADRCGMSPASLSEMKNTIIKALQVLCMCVCVCACVCVCVLSLEGLTVSLA